MCLAAGSATTRECDLTGEKKHDNYFFLFVLRFTLLISIKSGDPAHLGELLGAWQSSMPAQGRACLRVCLFYHKCPPPPSCISSFFLLISRFNFISLLYLPFLSFMPCLFFLSLILVFFPSSSFSSLFLSDSPFSSLHFSLCLSLSLSPSSPQMHINTHGHYTHREKQNLIVWGAEGHFPL